MKVYLVIEEYYGPGDAVQVGILGVFASAINAEIARATRGAELATTGGQQGATVMEFEVQP